MIEPRDDDVGGHLIIRWIKKWIKKWHTNRETSALQSVLKSIHQNSYKIPTKTIDDVSELHEWPEWVNKHLDLIYEPSKSSDSYPKPSKYAAISTTIQITLKKGDHNICPKLFRSILFNYIGFRTSANATLILRSDNKSTSLNMVPNRVYYYINMLAPYTTCNLCLEEDCVVEFDVFIFSTTKHRNVLTYGFDDVVHDEIAYKNGEASVRKS